MPLRSRSAMDFTRPYTPQCLHYPTRSRPLPSPVPGCLAQSFESSSLYGLSCLGGPSGASANWLRLGLLVAWSDFSSGGGPLLKALTSKFRDVGQAVEGKVTGSSPPFGAFHPGPNRRAQDEDADGPAPGGQDRTVGLGDPHRRGFRRILRGCGRAARRRFAGGSTWFWRGWELALQDRDSAPWTTLFQARGRDSPFILHGKQ